MSNEDMTNEDYKEKIRIINDKLLNNISENYILRYWYLCLAEIVKKIDEREKQNEIYL